MGVFHIEINCVLLFIYWLYFFRVHLLVKVWNTVMRRLTTGIRSDKCVVRRFRRCANVIESTYTNLDSTAYYTPMLYGITYCS